MSSPMMTKDVPALTDKRTRRVYIKNGNRRVMTDSGYMLLPSDISRRMFGRMRGGKYSQSQ